MAGPCDFSRSYIRWIVEPNPDDKRTPGHMPWENSARIHLDAICTITDQALGLRERFVLIAPCRTEWMYRDETLFQVPSHEYRGIWSEKEFASAAGGIGAPATQSTPRGISEAFTFYEMIVATHDEAAAPETDAEVVEATIRGDVLVGHTELDGPDGLHAVLEYPIKTMNVQIERGRFQVDTGPIVWPDLEAPHTSAIDRCRVAHIGYNRRDVAEFVVRGHVELGRAGERVGVVDYATDVRRLPASSNVFCVR